MNEVDPNDKTDFGASPPMATTIALLSVFHFVCCGVPLLLLSGVSLVTLLPSWPVVGGASALLGLTASIWYLKKRCPTCPIEPVRGAPNLRTLNVSGDRAFSLDHVNDRTIRRVRS